MFDSNKHREGVPDSYFDNLSERVIKNIMSEKEDLSKEAPILSSISKVIPFNVPNGYFENLEPKCLNKPKTKVISIFKVWSSVAATFVLLLSSWILCDKTKENENLVTEIEAYDYYLENSEEIDEELLWSLNQEDEFDLGFDIIEEISIEEDEELLQELIDDFSFEEILEIL